MEDAGHESNPSDPRLLFRLAVGAAALGRERLVSELRSWDREVRAGGLPERLDGDHPARHRLVGAMVMAPGYVTGAARRARHAYARSAGRLVAPLGARWLRTEPGRRLSARAHALRERLELEVATWEVVGRVEEREGRALAHAGYEAASETFFRHLAQNPELRDLIAEQSAGLTRTFLTDVREIGASADTRVEAAIRRLLRRPPRPAPTGGPLPAGE